MTPIIDPLTGNISFSRGAKKERRVSFSGGGQSWYGGDTLPDSGTLFQLFVNTTDNTLYYWGGSAWIALSGGTPPTSNNLLLEDGSYILLEDGSKLILE